MHGVDKEGGDLPQALARFHGTTNDFVVDIGDVAHIGDAISHGTQPALPDIEAHQHARVPKMAEVVNRHAADIHADVPRFNGAQRFLVARKGIVNMQHLPFLSGVLRSHASPLGPDPFKMGVLAKARLKWWSLSIARPL